MNTFWKLLDTAATIGFLYFMLKAEPDQRAALWMLAVRSGCHMDFIRRLEKQANWLR